MENFLDLKKMEILAWNSTRKIRVKNTRLLSVIQTAEFSKRVEL